MIEKDLRIQIHGVLVQKLKQQNPLDEAVYDYMNFLSIEDIILFENRINLKAKVSQYLSEKFYEMTALTPIDWKTYEHIRVLAKQTYNLDILETHLPSKTTDQNVDILQLIRNIHKYCSMYHYNLHTQIFVEKNWRNKADKNSWDKSNPSVAQNSRFWILELGSQLNLHLLDKANCNGIWIFARWVH